MRKFTRICAFTLSTALLLGTIPGAFASAKNGMDNFTKKNTYRTDQFVDVCSDDWFYTGVKKSYELGLMNGVSQDVFSASTEVTGTQAIAVAARIHSIYTTGEDSFRQGTLWYDVYVRYALENGIIDSRYNCRAAATRGKFADILARSLPASALAAKNDIPDGSIPDVKMDAEYASSIYRLYRAGVLTGSDSRGHFCPDSTITRAEAAVIIARIVDPKLRQSVTLTYSGPELSEGPERDDAFFADAAYLGNSLVDGLRLFAGLKTVDFYCATSVSVVSAMNSATTPLANGSKGTLVQALTEKQYGKIYIELGINEIGYDSDYFAGLYGAMIDQIQAKEPEADIYISAVLPVTKKKNDSGQVFNNTRVRLYNDTLRKLAEEKNCYFLDLYSAFADADGNLPAEWSSDGVHLQAAYYSVWEKYMRTHY